MELRHLRYFVAVAEELHFGRAAERLHIAQPPLSQQIRQLEEEMGLRLFYRTKRRVQLTEAGGIFLEGARQTLAQAEQAVRAAQRADRGETGRLSIGFLGSATLNVLPPSLRLFQERFPNVQLELYEYTTTQQVEALLEGKIHVGFLRRPVDDRSLRLHTVFQEDLIAALRENHPLTGRSRLRLRDLAGEAFILPPRQASSAYHDLVVSLCRRAGFSPHMGQEAVHIQTIVSLVAAGLGVSLLPSSAHNLGRKGVVYRRLEGPAPKIETALAWRRDNPPPVLRAFVRVVREATEAQRPRKQARASELNVQPVNSFRIR